MGWKVNVWARFRDGDHALKILDNLLAPVGSRKDVRGGLYLNLFDAHPPFQIDGNFGYTAGVGEMLLGGCDGTVSLLHALPKEWHTGKFSGLVSRGGVVFDCEWEMGKVTSLSATARKDVTIKLIIPGENGERITLDGMYLKAGEYTEIIK
jgi:alpha-L-fucosidase 2